MSFFKSQDCHILWRVYLEWTKYRGVKTFGMVICIIPYRDIFSHHLKKYRTTSRLMLLTNIIMDNSRLMKLQSLQCYLESGVGTKYGDSYNNVF